ncbi:transmembrane protein 98 isoform X1 [Antennarius striatus]|uniref:transmembrane protein 98 isoform X1 n=2 Tax=Antennarius striatus TaxID=241820 RepID=UPI0035B12EB5
MLAPSPRARLQREKRSFQPEEDKRPGELENVGETISLMIRCAAFQPRQSLVLLAGSEVRDSKRSSSSLRHYPTGLRYSLPPPPADEQPFLIRHRPGPASPNLDWTFSRLGKRVAVVGPGVAMETVVIVAIGVLATIFLASFVALVVVCRHRYCHPHNLLYHFDSKPTVDLIGAMETQSEPSELELDDVVITNPHIEAILENEDWIEDASGLVSHCISILKICHTLTEKLVAMTMGSGAKVKAPASLSDIITVAKRISPRVDDVVRSMYPPLDPILLDARATALLLSVSHLVLVTRNACHMSGSMDWIDQSLHAAEDHMVVLREAALASEPERSVPGGADAQREQAI